MTNLELLNKIKAEIERLKNKNVEWRERINSEDGYSYESDVCCGYDEAIEDFETFLDSLPEEKLSEDLNDEIKKFIEEYEYERGEDKLLISIVARHFAEWQKQCDAELIEIAYNDGITIGKTKQRSS